MNLFSGRSVLVFEVGKPCLRGFQTQAFERKFPHGVSDVNVAPVVDAELGPRDEEDPKRTILRQLEQ